MSFSKRLFVPFLAVLTVGAAFTLSFVWPRHNGLGVDIDGSARAQAARDRDPYDLTQVAVLSRCVQEVNQNYVDRSRIDWRKMFLSGLDAIQRTVAPVLVQYHEGDAELVVQVHDARKSFRVSDVASPWALTDRFRDVFAFLQHGLGDEEGLELRDVEYAAVNGMLRTLDPHSVLLTPDIFEEMQMSTRGEFGGLGIVISMRDGQLTVIRPMPNTPASGAGILRGDRIVQINDESTLNMPLSEAVNRLRGVPGSRVDVWISRRQPSGQWAPKRKVQLVRAVIHIESVEHRMLEANVGYVKINSFQGNTHEDLVRALAELHRGNMRGLVLDLRDDPGGLLDQAVRVADTFLTRGTIVSTQSRNPRERDVREAQERGTEPNYPMVVLINGGSASASEIVAGALKNHDRALVVGQRSFGKGSVQIIYNLNDGSALKLTIAQYLTPGEVSIQGVGIVPDIAIDPMTADREDMDLVVDEHGIRESDLHSHLTNAAAVDGQRPSTVLRYYLPIETRRRLQEAGPDDREENEQEAEFLTRFAGQLLARAQRPGRREMLRDAQPVVEQTRQEEMAKAVEELRRLGVDWSTGADQGESTVTVEATTDKAGNAVTAGEDFHLKVRVTNTGTHTLYQLRAITKSDNALFDQRELVFGRLAPGETREWTASLALCTRENEQRVCRVPRSADERADVIRVRFEEANGHAPPEAVVRTEIRALARPAFTYAVQFADDQPGANGDGVLQRGERGSLYLRVKNVGQGRTFTTEANLASKSGRGVLLREGRFRLDAMNPGEERLVRFGFEVLSDFQSANVKLEVQVTDTDLREGVSHKIEIPIGAGNGSATARSGVATLAAGAVVRERPAADAPVVARARAASVVATQAQLGAFQRIDLGGGQPGWVEASALSAGRGAARPQVDFVLSEQPPVFHVQHEGTLVTREGSVRVHGDATDDARVRDLYIFAGNNKVFYRSNPATGDTRRLDFDVSVPLRDGMNFVIVVARESDQVVSRHVLVIRRDGPNGEILETPRLDEDEAFDEGE
ncbi:MAG: MXAN_5808 family serine peptidase [Polyangiales bacterium]